MTTAFRPRNISRCPRVTRTNARHINAAPVSERNQTVAAIVRGRMGDRTEDGRSSADSGERERSLRLEVAILRSTLDAAADGIVVVDAHGNVLYCNDNY